MWLAKTLGYTTGCFRASRVNIVQLSLKVPGDAGIVSYDDVPEAATFSPPQTTVHVPRREIGRRAARLLLGWPDSGSVPENVLPTSELVVRGSTQKKT